MKTKRNLVLGSLLVAVVTAFQFLPQAQKPAPLIAPTKSNSPNHGSHARSRNVQPGAVSVEHQATAVDFGHLKAVLSRGDKTEIEAALGAFAGSAQELDSDEIATLLPSLSDDALSRAVPVLAALDPNQFGAMGNRLIMQAVRRLVETEQLPTTERQAALAKLGKAWRVTPDLMQTAVRVACEDTEDPVRLSAIATMASWMGTNPYLNDTLTPDLIRICNAENSREVRNYAIQTLAAHHRAEPEKILSVLQDFIENEPTPQNRLLAALAIGGQTAETKDFAMTQLQQAFLDETDAATRKNILSELVRIGQTNAVAILAQFPTNDKLVAQDTTDYMEILQSGVTDFNEINDLKVQREMARGTFKARPDGN